VWVVEKVTSILTACTTQLTSKLFRLFINIATQVNCLHKLAFHVLHIHIRYILVNNRTIIYISICILYTALYTHHQKSKNTQKLTRILNYIIIDVW